MPSSSAETPCERSRVVRRSAAEGDPAGRRRVRRHADRKRPHVRHVAVPAGGELLPVDLRLERAIDGLEEIVAVRLRVKPDQVGAEQPVEDVALPGADAERLGIRPRNVPEDADARVRPRLLDHPRQEREVIVLHEHHRARRALDLLDHGFGELPVRFAIARPVGLAEQGPRVRDVAERPHALVGEAVVVAFFFLGRQPDAAQRVLGVVGRHAEAIPVVDPLAVGVAGTVRDPRARARPQHGLERRDEAARRNQQFDRAALVDVDVRLAIRDDDQRPAVEPAAHVRAQPLRRPVVRRRIAQPRFLFRRRPSGLEAADQVDHLLEQRPEEPPDAERDAALGPEPMRLQPVDRPPELTDDLPAHEQQDDQRDQRCFHQNPRDGIIPEEVHEALADLGRSKHQHRRRGTRNEPNDEPSRESHHGFGRAIGEQRRSRSLPPPIAWIGRNIGPERPRSSYRVERFT